jgi:hypothetical protein
MIEKNWKVDFYLEGHFISIINYPLMLCPVCASLKIGKNINTRVLEKLSEKAHSRLESLSAIKFEEHF